MYTMQFKTDIPKEYLPYLAPTAIVDSDHPEVRSFAELAVGESREPVEQAVKLYLAVRDGIRYDPYAPFYLPEHYRASYVIRRGRSFCIPKASLLCAAARACGIPCRLGFANVRNHLATKQLLDFLGANIFVFHAFVELYLEGRWVKATPAFNRELCVRHGVAPLEFNGREDSLFQSYNEENQRYMEYLEFIGHFTDIPVADILSSWEHTYGKGRVESWIRMFEEREAESSPGFEHEEVFSE